MRRTQGGTVTALKRLIEIHGIGLTTFGFDEVHYYGGASPSAQRTYPALIFSVNDQQVIATVGRQGWSVTRRG